jgi:hypothetical protein
VLQRVLGRMEPDGYPAGTSADEVRYAEDCVAAFRAYARCLAGHGAAGGAPPGDG